VPIQCATRSGCAEEDQVILNALNYVRGRTASQIFLAERHLLAEGRALKALIDSGRIHRFSKSQQDALLPAEQNGWIILVGATTENLRSRSTRRCCPGACVPSRGAGGSRGDRPAAPRSGGLGQTWDGRQGPTVNLLPFRSEHEIKGSRAVAQRGSDRGGRGGTPCRSGRAFGSWLGYWSA